jgi:hypothetical protein
MLCLLSYPASDHLRAAVECPRPGAVRALGHGLLGSIYDALQAGNFVSEALCLGFRNIHHENMKFRPWPPLKTLRF